MPKVAGDPELRRRLHNHVEHSGKGITSAADELGLPRVLTWRFLKTGRVLPRNAILIRGALDRVEAVGSSRAEADRPVNSLETEQNEITKHDVARLRAFLHHVLAVVDAYEQTFLRGRGLEPGQRPMQGTRPPDGRSG